MPAVRVQQVLGCRPAISCLYAVRQHCAAQVFVPREDLSLDVIKQYQVVTACFCTAEFYEPVPISQRIIP